MEYKTTQSSEEAPFNSAVDCLMRISSLLKKIEKVSVEYILDSKIFGFSLTAGQAQAIKLRLIRQLCVQATPLLTAKAQEDALIMIKNIFIDVEKPINKIGKTINRVEKFSEEINFKLDEISIFIQKDLQQQGYFMPPKKNLKRILVHSH